MKLCMALIEDQLEMNVTCRGYDAGGDPFDLDGWELPGSTALGTGVLYLTDPKGLEELTVPPGVSAAVICAGTAPFAAADRYFAVDAQLPELINAVNRIFLQFAGLENRLLEAAAVKHSMQALVDIMGPYFPNQLSICTLDFRVVGQTPGPDRILHDSGFPQPDSSGQLPPEVVSYFKNEPQFTKIRNIREPFFYEPSIYAYRVHFINVFYCGEPVCRVTHPDPSGRPRSYDAGLLIFFARYVQMIYELAGGDAASTPKDGLREALIGLLSGDGPDGEQLQEAFDRRSWPAGGPFVCACLLPGELDVYNRTISYYCRTLSARSRGVCVFEFEELIACVADLSAPGGADFSFSSWNAEYLRDNYFLAGMSNEFSDLSQLRSYWMQAKIALRVGRTTEPTLWKHSFSESVLPYLIGRLPGELDAEHLCAPELLLLRDYDGKNNTAYFATLKNYLACGMNAVQTARELYIHRATMMYRLERIRALTGLDLGSEKTRLYLALSFALLEPPPEKLTEAIR